MGFEGEIAGASEGESNGAGPGLGDPAVVRGTVSKSAVGLISWAEAHAIC